MAQYRTLSFTSRRSVSSIEARACRRGRRNNPYGASGAKYEAPTVRDGGTRTKYGPTTKMYQRSGPMYEATTPNYKARALKGGAPAKMYEAPAPKCGAIRWK